MRDTSKPQVALLTGVLLLAAALRMVGLAQDVRFHPDEAFFSAFARDAVSYGTWMFPGPLDKTPLSLYASALSIHFLVTSTRDNLIYVDVRAGEFAARLPNVFASVVLVALLARLSKVRARYAASRQTIATSDDVMLLTGFLAATSPFLLVFAPSAFTDVFMLFGMVAALLAVMQARPAWGGVWLAFSFAAKQQGVLYLPLLLVLAWMQGGRHILRLLVTFGLGVMLVLLWDAARGEVSIFAQASLNNDPGRVFVQPSEWLPRLRVWLGYLGWSLGPPWFTWPLLVVILWQAVHKQRVSVSHRIIAAYAVLYGAAHVVVAVNLYDRYMLPVVPLLILMAGQTMTHYLRRPYLRRIGMGLRLVFVMVLLMTAVGAVTGGVSLGRDGYPRRPELLPLVAHLNAKPLGTIVYDRWLGWELGYYMGSWSDKRRVYYPTPEAMMADALQNPERAPRYFVAPQGAEAEPWLRAFEKIGFAVSLDYANADYRVFALVLAGGAVGPG
ncbi:MAG: hypothetical protein OHK0046_28310 [Anaerolineae bacterium]